MKYLFIMLMFCCSITWGEEGYFEYTTDNSNIAVIEYTPCTKIVFGNNSESYISWESGRLVFSGNAEKSAEIFFTQFLRPLVDEYIREKLKSNFAPKNRSY